MTVSTKAIDLLLFGDDAIYIIACGVAHGECGLLHSEYTHWRCNLYCSVLLLLTIACSVVSPPSPLLQK